MYKQSIEYLISVYNNIEFNCIYTAASSQFCKFYRLLEFNLARNLQITSCINVLLTNYIYVASTHQQTELRPNTMNTLRLHIRFV